MPQPKLIDPTQLQLSTAEIIPLLREMTDIITAADGSGALRFRGFEPFIVACEEYQKLSQCVFAVDWAEPSNKEILTFVAAAFDIARAFRKLPKKSEVLKFREHLTLIPLGFYGTAATLYSQLAAPSVVKSELIKSGFPTATPELAADAARKTIELMVALGGANKFSNVDLESPVNSSSGPKNPDLIILFDGKRYGVACKSLSTLKLNPRSFRNNLKDGINQITAAINAGTVDRECGFVFLDISACLPHEKLYSPGTGLAYIMDMAREVLRQEINTVLYSLMGGKEKEIDFVAKYGSLFRGKPLHPGVLVYSNNVMLCVSSEGEIPFPNYMKFSTYLGQWPNKELECFSSELINSLHCQ